MSTKHLAPLPAMPSSSRPATLTPCECGCGEMAKRRFLVGHDSYLDAWGRRVRKGVVAWSDVPLNHRVALERRHPELAPGLSRDEFDRIDNEDLMAFFPPVEDEQVA